MKDPCAKCKQRPYLKYRTCKPESIDTLPPCARAALRENVWLKDVVVGFLEGYMCSRFCSIAITDMYIAARIAKRKEKK